MSLVISYILFVVVGPMVFVGLIRPRPTRQRFAMGCASAGMLLGAAFVLRGVGNGDALASIGGLACLWLGWIVTIAMAVQAYALAAGFGRQRKWSAAIGAAATMLPWFGLSLAMTTAG